MTRPWTNPALDLSCPWCVAARGAPMRGRSFSEEFPALRPQRGTGQILDRAEQARVLARQVDYPSCEILECLAWILALRFGRPDASCGHGGGVWK